MPPPPRRTVVCFTPFGADWTWFVQGLTAPDVRWSFTSDKGTRPWHDRLQRPNLLTPAAALRTVLRVRREGAALLITIDARLSFWCGLWCRVLGVRVPHLSFSFNFPHLPGRRKLPLFRYAYAQLHRARVHSSLERHVYAEVFGMPEERLRLALWSMNTPPIEPAAPLLAGDYICAVGGNARDYLTLAEAARLLPDVPQVWVVRPESLAGITVPPHVRVVANISYAASMNYLAHSRFMVLPLQDAATPTGHVTLVSAMLLGRAFVVTQSAGVADYVQNGVTGVTVPPADAPVLAVAIEQLWRDPERAAALGADGRAFAERECSDAHTAAEMTAYFAELGLAR